ncbi:MAG TPA: hypothetical protein VHB77_07315 [Planctomycetaceae bacterium]|nr:hypothetical protein [Planctomycetaceae bacterium]
MLGAFMVRRTARTAVFGAFTRATGTTMTGSGTVFAATSVLRRTETATAKVLPASEVLALPTAAESTEGKLPAATEVMRSESRTTMTRKTAEVRPTMTKAVMSEPVVPMSTMALMTRMPVVAEPTTAKPVMSESAMAAKAAMAETVVSTMAVMGETAMTLVPLVTRGVVAEVTAAEAVMSERSAVAAMMSKGSAEPATAAKPAAAVEAESTAEAAKSAGTALSKVMATVTAVTALRTVPAMGEVAAVHGTALAELMSPRFRATGHLVRASAVIAPSGVTSPRCRTMSTGTRSAWSVTMSARPTGSTRSRTVRAGSRRSAVSARTGARSTFAGTAGTAFVGIGHDGFFIQRIDRIGDLFGSSRQAVVRDVPINFGERRRWWALRILRFVGPGGGDGERAQGCCGHPGRQSRLQHFPKLPGREMRRNFDPSVTASHKLVTHSPSACAEVPDAILTEVEGWPRFAAARSMPHRMATCSAPRLDVCCSVELPAHPRNL